MTVNHTSISLWSHHTMRFSHGQAQLESNGYLSKAADEELSSDLRETLGQVPGLLSIFPSNPCDT